MIEPKDRITQAWELRRDLHAYLVKMGKLSMAEIKARFPSKGYETLRATLDYMRKRGWVEMVGKNTGSCYVALVAEIETEEEMRERFRAGAEKGRQQQIEAKIKTRNRGPNVLADEAVTIIPKDEPWRTIHRGLNRKHPLKSQQAQGNSRPRGATALEAMV